MFSKILCLVVVGAAIQSAAAFTELQESMLAAHNAYRAKHGVPPLVLDEKLNHLAENWSHECVKTGKLAHRPNNKFGECVYWGGDSNKIHINAALGKSSVDSWYSEIKDYDFNNGAFGMNTGHFTQVVWKNSQRLGCGCATPHEAHEVYCTCNYDPPGNYAGEFAENVLPPQ